MDLQAYDFTVIHRKGVEIINLDGLSRLAHVMPDTPTGRQADCVAVLDSDAHLSGQPPPSPPAPTLGAHAGPAEGVSQAERRGVSRSSPSLTGTSPSPSPAPLRTSRQSPQKVSKGRRLPLRKTVRGWGGGGGGGSYMYCGSHNVKFLPGCVM